MTNTAQLNGSATAQSGHWPEIEIGDEKYTIVPQRIGRLKKHLGREFTSLAEMDFDGGLATFVAESLERAHRLLKVMIPDLMPVWEFCGYRSEEAMEADDYHDDGKQYGPTVPQVVHAIEEVMRVNRLDLLKHLGKFLDLNLLKAYANKAVAEAMAGETTKPMTTLPSSSSTTGPPTPSMMSGMTDPTSVTSTD